MNSNSDAETSKTFMSIETPINIEELQKTIWSFFFHQEPDSQHFSTPSYFLFNLCKQINSYYSKHSSNYGKNISTLNETFENFFCKETFISDPIFCIFPYFIDSICIIIAHYFKINNLKKHKFCGKNHVYFNKLHLITCEDNIIEYDTFEIINDTTKCEIDVFNMMIDAFILKKKLILAIPSFYIDDNVYTFYMFFLLNISWLFQNAIEFEINLSNENNFFDKGYSNEGKEREIAFYYLLINIFDNFEQIIQCTKIYKLILIIPYAFTLEINAALTKNLINVNMDLSYHLLLSLIISQQPITQIKSLLIEINCIDSMTFKTIISLLNLNSANILELEIYLFPKSNVNSYFTSYQLSKLISSNTVINCEDNFTSKEPEFYLAQLLKKLNTNLNRFIKVLNQIQNLKNVIIHINYPDVLVPNYRYGESLIKFITDLVNLYDNKIISTLEIHFDNFNLDGAYYVFINNTLDKIEPNYTITNFTLDKIKISNVENLFNLIPKNVKSLTLGKIDIDTCFNLLNDISLFRRLELLEFTVFSVKQGNHNEKQLIERILKGKSFGSDLKEVHAAFDITLDESLCKEIVEWLGYEGNFIKKWVVTLYKEKIVFDKGTDEEKFKHELEKTSNQWKCLENNDENIKKAVFQVCMKKYKCWSGLDVILSFLADIVNKDIDINVIKK